MFNIKKRVIDLKLLAITSKPVVKTLSNKKSVCYFRALVSYPEAKCERVNLFCACMFLDIITYPYTLPLWLTIWRKCKKDTLLELDYLKIWGYPFKPNRDNVGFYILDATERLCRDINYNCLGEDKEEDNLQRLANTYNGVYVGVDYLKSKYPELKEKDRSNDFNILTNYFLTKNKGKNAVIYYPKDLSQTIHLQLEQKLYKITNPNDKEELRDKPLYYQLLNTLADSLCNDYPELTKPIAIRFILANTTYKAQTPKSTNNK